MMSLSGKAYQVAGTGSGATASLRKAVVSFIRVGSLQRLLLLHRLSRLEAKSVLAARATSAGWICARR
jgi:hypothetical protein